MTIGSTRKEEVKVVRARRTFTTWQLELWRGRFNDFVWWTSRGPLPPLAPLSAHICQGGQLYWESGRSAETGVFSGAFVCVCLFLFLSVCLFVCCVLVVF